MNNITIEVVRETGCFMYLDNEGNYLKSFFIGQYWFDIMTDQQKQTLKELLQKDNIEPFEIYYKHGNVYLTFVNFKNKHCIYEIYNTGEAKCHLQLEFIDTLKCIDYSAFNLLHDFKNDEVKA